MLVVGFGRRLNKSWHSTMVREGYLKPEVFKVLKMGLWLYLIPSNFTKLPS